MSSADASGRGSFRPEVMAMTNTRGRFLCVEAKQEKKTARRQSFFGSYLTVRCEMPRIMYTVQS
jgi:hypothetical protein